MEALDVVKRMVEDGCISQEVAEKYCPEIKKYKDEIVRNQILELIRQHSVNSDRCVMENWICDHALLQPFKPSEEQVKAVKDAIDYLGCNTKKVRENLMSLHEQLKKLREKQL